MRSLLGHGVRSEYLRFVARRSKDLARTLEEEMETPEGLVRIYELAGPLKVRARDLCRKLDAACATIEGRALNAAVAGVIAARLSVLDGLVAGLRLLNIHTEDDVADADAENVGFRKQAVALIALVQAHFDAAQEEVYPYHLPRTEDPADKH